MRTKFWILISFAALSMSLQATTFTFTSANDTVQDKDNIIIELAKGSGSTKPAYQEYNAEMRLYANNTITIVAEQITSVQIVFSKAASGKAYASLSASTGTLVSGGESTSNTDKKIDTWTGASDILVLTMGTTGQRSIYQLVVNGDPIVINPEEEENYIDTTALDPDFAYSEPTAIIVPDWNFFKQEYAFVQSNIRVSCTQGTILNNDTAVYFNCNAGYQLTFEAAKPIKGLIINGYVRKLFTASVDNGDIEYCSPEEDDLEGDPVVIISDVDATTVTISCDKQLRCYSVHVYFDENPTAELDCGGNTGSGDIFFLTFDVADVVYESEITELYNELNYTVFLYNTAEPEYPYVAIDLYPAANDIVGTYNSDDESLGEYSWYQFGPDDWVDCTWMTEGQAAITKSGEIYTISGYLTGDDTNTYNFTFTGEVNHYTDTEYYEQEGIEGVYPPLNPKAPMYDLLGRPVDKDYRGIVIQNGYKYLVR